MTGKTKISVTVKFDNNVPLSHVASSLLQKQKDGMKTKKTLAITKPGASAVLPVLHWDELTDPINKTVTLALKEVTITVTFNARIWIDKAIDKKSVCYTHVFDHEKRHAKIRRAGVKKYGKDIVKAVTDATAPGLDAPVEVKANKVKAFRAAAYNKINAAMDVAIHNCAEKMRLDSIKIHTPAELKKTNSLCALYLT